MCVALGGPDMLPSCVSGLAASHSPLVRLSPGLAPWEQGGVQDGTGWEPREPGSGPSSVAATCR